MKIKLSKTVYAVHESRKTPDGRPVSKTFTELAWKLTPGSGNERKGWRRISNPKSIQPTKMDEKIPKVDATRTAVDLAKEKGVNITLVEGTGTDGRILKADVEQYLIDTAQQNKPNEEEE